MRALPALSLAYFGSSALGNTALPVAAGAGAGAAGAVSFTSFLGLASAAFGSAGAAGAARAAAGVAVGAAPPAALRKILPFLPLWGPPLLPPLYFTPPSLTVCGH